MTVCIIGAGAFGTALACAIAAKGETVRLWARRSEDVLAALETRHFPRLPGVELAENILPTDHLSDSADADVLLLAVPAQQTETFLAAHAAELPDVPVVLCAKGIDLQSFRLQSEIATAHLRRAPAVLTGPGFAVEIAVGKPTALTLACADLDVGHVLQRRLSTDRLRLYLTPDVIGAQLGGALKNVIAIAAGMAIGAGLGESARAALMTRGFAEMRRLGVAMGGQEETFVGLSGLGDLALTCATPMSRNFAQGLELGQGGGLQSGKTVEGVATAQAAVALARKYQVEMPITQAVAAVLAGRYTIQQAMDALLSRPLKQE